MADGFVPRSNRRDVRNPIWSLPAMHQVLALPLESRAAIEALVSDIGDDAKRRAQESWRKNKGTMAAYWKAVGAYAEPIRRVLKRYRDTAPPQTAGDGDA